MIGRIGIMGNLYLEGKEIGRDYYLAGCHVYEFFRQGGSARIAFTETPEGDGKMAWQENGGEAFFRSWETGDNYPPEKY